MTLAGKNVSEMTLISLLEILEISWSLVSVLGDIFSYGDAAFCHNSGCLQLLHISWNSSFLLEILEIS